MPYGGRGQPIGQAFEFYNDPNTQVPRTPNAASQINLIVEPEESLTLLQSHILNRVGYNRDLGATSTGYGDHPNATPSHSHSRRLAQSVATLSPEALRCDTLGNSRTNESVDPTEHCRSARKLLSVTGKQATLALLSSGPLIMNSKGREWSSLAGNPANKIWVSAAMKMGCSGNSSGAVANENHWFLPRIASIFELLWDPLAIEDIVSGKGNKMSPQTCDLVEKWSRNGRKKKAASVRR
ncbi:hypothetical protein DFH07DRAFT_943231 [Mycena maculata]|uniref:Uncharacterized protein n=1 Tax=Mycena maculata TaxID=230809 RepID=A0AAD7IH99_9AGAR|nr:hypothetical protein DFH07DRAFT_943231 [Mycena maculata]